MSLLLTQSWNVLREREDEYEEFISKKFIPRCDELGLKSVGGFYVESGCGPQIISIKSVESLAELFRILSGPEFAKVKKGLKNLVSQYSSRVLVQRRKLGPEKYSIQQGVWKFNQYFDIRPGREDDYDTFMSEEFIPGIATLDYVEFTREWNVLVGGFSEMLLELTFQDPVDIGRLIGSDVFRGLSFQLAHEYGDNFQNRVLRATERFDKARWYRL